VYGAKNRNRGIRGKGCVDLTFDPTRQMLTDPETYVAERAAEYQAVEREPPKRQQYHDFGEYGIDPVTGF
jgi:hypothetical protein